MARKKVVYVYFYTNNNGRDTGGEAHRRLVVCNTFSQAYDEMTKDYHYLMDLGWTPGDAWYNDYQPLYATAAVITMFSPSGERMDLNIFPSVIY